MTDISPQLVMGVCMAAVFFGVIAIFALYHYFNPKNVESGKRWMFADWEEDVYDTFFKTQPEEIAKKIGINPDKYKHNSKLCKTEPKLKKVVVDRITGILAFILFLTLSIVTNGLVLLLFGILIGFPLIFWPTYRVNQNVTKRRFQVADELPRFLDLLHTALLIELPTEQAIEITADNLPDTILAEEFKLALADTKLGAYSWQRALERMAADYEVDVLSDFVLDVVNAHNNGASIVDSVARKSKDIKQSNLLTMKERANRLTSTILLPIMVFKMLPLLLLICIPIAVQLGSSGIL